MLIGTIRASSSFPRNQYIVEVGGPGCSNSQGWVGMCPCEVSS